MDLCEDPYFLFVARFIGPPAMNNMPATIEQSGAQTVVALQSGDHVKVPVASVDAMQGAAVHFGVRPEDLRLPEAGGGPPHGTVSVTGSLGEVTLGYMDSTGLDEPIIVKLQGNQVIKRGQQLSLDADSDKPHLFNGSRISPRHLNRPRNLGLSMLFVRDMFRSNINRNHNRNGHQSQICGVDGASRQTNASSRRRTRFPFVLGPRGRKHSAIRCPNLCAARSIPIRQTGRATGVGHQRMQSTAWRPLGTGSTRWRVTWTAGSCTAGRAQNPAKVSLSHRLPEMKAFANEPCAERSIISVH